MYRLLIITVFLTFHFASGLDADALQKDSKSRDHFLKCLLQTGPCNKDEAAFRAGIPEVLSTTCGKCTEPQKEFFVKMSRFVHQTRPDVWKVLWDKYDPTRKNEKNILKFIGVAA